LILYEYPLNERIRTLLRLEDLFTRLDYFIPREHPLEHHVALTTLFDILDVAARADLKSDLLQELDRQRQTLTQYRNNPAVALNTLDQILQRIEDLPGPALSAHDRQDRPAPARQRMADEHPQPRDHRGGACEFDLPSYHAWQHRPATGPDARHLGLWRPRSGRCTRA
jgi:cell division protein ZapD